MDEANGRRTLGRVLGRRTLRAGVVTPVLSTGAVGDGGDLHMER
jgi:hypothetical protein